MNFFSMSGGARLLYILRRAHVLHGDDAYLVEARKIAAKLIGAGCEVVRMNSGTFASMEAALIANTERSGACPQRSEDSRRGASRRNTPPSNTGMNK